MRFLFFIQGEGRGHQTQALALHSLLTRAGHEVVAALVGTTEGRGIPALLRQGLPIPLVEIASPALLYSRRSKSLDVGRTLRVNLSRIPTYCRAARVVAATVHAHQPDVLVNFYEMACGIYHWLYQPGVPTVSIAHQFLLLHPQFQLPRTQRFGRTVVNQVTRMAGLGTARKLGLSFYELPDSESLHIFVTPPLLRQEVLQTDPESGDFLLAYMTHYRLSDDLVAWSSQHPSVKIEAFWDKPNAPETWVASPSLRFHRVSAAGFLEAMRGCRGLVSTAGFEAVCEAMYLGKPVMMLPVPGHFEQACNAYDAEQAGAGLRATSFAELDRFEAYLPRHRSIQEPFRAWVAQTDARFLSHLTAAASDPPARIAAPLRLTGWLLRKLFG